MQNPQDWPDSREFWHNRRVMVTGGNGFLGKHLVRKLHERGAAEIIVPRGKDYDLRDINAIRRLLQDATGKSAIRNPKSKIMVIHLAARVGGIGANLEHPAEFFYDNLMMGAPLLHESYVAGVEKFVAWARFAAIPSSRRCPSAKRTCGTAIPRRPMRPMAWPRRCCWCRARPIASSTGSTVFC